MSATAAKACKGMSMEGPLAHWYASITGKNTAEFAKAARSIAAQLPAGGDVLEVAPGPGFVSIELARLGAFRVVGLDLSRTLVRIATANAAKAGVAVEFRQGNASAMPQESDSFDFVYCRAAFKNFSEPVLALNEMHRVLRPGGKAVIVDLRNDASPEAIAEAVGNMRLGRIQSLVVKSTFKHMLLKRAYSQQDFQQMAAQTPFKTAQIECDLLSIEVTLRK